MNSIILCIHYHTTFGQKVKIYILTLVYYEISLYFTLILFFVIELYFFQK